MNTRRCRAALLAALLTGAPAAAAHAQTAPTLVTSLPTERTLATPSPLPQSGVEDVTPAMFLSATRGDGVARLQAGARVGWSPVFGRLSLIGEASAPLDDDAPHAVLAGLQGLNTGTTVGLNLTGVAWARKAPDAVIDAWCEEKKRAGETFDGKACSEVGGEDVPRALRAEYLRISGFRRPAVYAARISVTHGELRFLDAATLEPASMEATSISAGADYGGFVGTALWTVGARWTRSFSENPEEQVCTPMPEHDGASVCRTAPVGAPLRLEAMVLNGQLKMYLSSRVAINPRLTHRVRDEVWAAEVPIFFASDGNGGLTGGILPAWNSVDERLTIGIFVGMPFRLGIR